MRFAFGTDDGAQRERLEVVMTRLFVRKPAARRQSRKAPGVRVAGAFTGPMPASADRAAAMERWLGVPLDVQTVFEPWDSAPDAVDGLFERLTAVWEAGRTPLLTWEPFTPTPAATADDVLRRIAAGECDAFLTRWADALAEWRSGPDGSVGTDDDRRLYLRPMHEPNGDWYPWAPAGGACPPATYVAAWRRAHRAVTDAGVTGDHALWIWAVNHVDVGDVTAEELFPGEGVVDLVGVDGFNWGASRPWSEWQSPSEVFGDMIERMRSHTSLPVCVPEFGCTSVTADGGDPVRKSRWLREAFSYFADEDLPMAAHFDVEKETDWQAFGGSAGENTIRIGGTRYQTYPGYRTGLREFLGL